MPNMTKSGESESMSNISGQQSENLKKRNPLNIPSEK